MKLNQVKIGAVLSYVIIVLNMAIGVLYTPILTSKLGQSEYGLYSIIVNIISYLTILDFGFGNAIIIYTTKYRIKGEKEKEEKLHGMFFVIYTVIGIIAGLIGVMLLMNLNSLFGNTMSIAEIEKAKILMGILIFNLVLTFPLSIFTSIVTAYEKFVFLKVLNIIRILLNPIIIIILLNIGYKSVALVVINTVFNIGTLLITCFYAIFKIKIKLKVGKFSKFLLFEITSISVWIFLNSIIDKVAWSLDQFILGAVCGTVQVAVYSVATQLNNIYLNFSTGISGVLLPKITKMETENATDKEYTDIFIKTGRIQYIVLGLIMSGFLLFGKEFINILWLGAEYNQAYYIACILMLPLTIPLIQNVGINILQVKKQYKFRVLILFVLAIINVIISIFLSRLYGGIGAALGTAITQIMGTGIIMNIFYYKKTRINIPEFWKHIGKMTTYILIVMGIGIATKYLWPINSKIVLILQILIYSMIYMGTIIKFVLNDYEKELFSSPIKKLKKIIGKRREEGEIVDKNNR